jgi:RNA polymerase sigma factor (sigma-70 family)
METDHHFLHQFVKSSDPEAFRVIVQRHSAMVQGVALRCTEDPALAEEVTQTVFAILARKAASFAHGNVGGWLYNAAFFESKAAAKRARRYRTILNQYGNQMNSTEPEAGDSWENIRHHLDEALSSLRDDDREIVVSHFFEKQRVRDIAGASGKSVEACRKKLQRAIIRLRERLRKRGVRTSSGFASALVTWQLCAPPASAATLTAAALKAAPTIKSAILLKHTLNLMSTASHIKVAAAVLVVASIPSIILWQKNSELEDQLAIQARKPRITVAEPVPKPPMPVKMAANPPKVLPKEAGAKPAKDPGAAFLEMLTSAGSTEKWAQDEGKKNADKEFKRLVLSIPDLTDEQKVQLKQAVDSRYAKLADSFNHNFPGGLGGMIKALSDPKSLTREQKEIFAAMDPRRKSETDGDNPLRSILSGPQYAHYSAAEERRRTEDAENAATDALKSVTTTVPLSAEQKDAIFQELAQSELSPADLELEIERMAASPGTDLRKAARDEIIRQHLTPEQLQAFNESREEEQKRTAEFLKLLGGKSAPPPGDDTEHPK